MTQARVAISEPLPDGHGLLGRVELEGVAPGFIMPVRVGEPRPIIYPLRTAGALSLTTTIATNFPGVLMKLKSIAVTFTDAAGTPTAPTTSQNLTLTLTPAINVRPSTVLYSGNPSVSSMLSMEKRWLGGRELELGDELTLAFTNTDTLSIKAEIVLERA